MNKYQVDVVLYLICGGFFREEMENVFIDFQFLGIDNVLVLWGDFIKIEVIFCLYLDGYCYVVEFIW